MENERRYILALAAIALAFALGVLALAWPNYRAVTSIKNDIAGLRGKLDTLGSQTATVEKLAEEIASARRAIERNFKAIPLSPDVAGLMSELSLPIDGDNVIDQTFTAGTPSPAVVGLETGPLRMPITVDMTGSFKSIFSLIDRAESLPRLIRVASVSVVRQPDPDNRQIPKLRAVISLEAIFDNAQASVSTEH